MTAHTVTTARADEVQPGDVILRHQTNPYRPMYALRTVEKIGDAPASMSDTKDFRFTFTDGGSVYHAYDEEVLLVLPPVKRSRWRR